MAAAGVTELAEGFGFDLADALARDGEVLSHFFKRVLTAILQAEAHFDNLLFARTERLKNFGGLFAQVQIDDGFGGRHHAAVYEEIAEIRFFFFTDRRL